MGILGNGKACGFPAEGQCPGQDTFLCTRKQFVNYYSAVAMGVFVLCYALDVFCNLR